MATKSRAVTVDTTATRLDSPAPTDSVSGSVCAPFNLSASTVYVGGSDVTTANGVPVGSNRWAPALELDPGESYWAVVAEGTAEMRVCEQGV